MIANYHTHTKRCNHAKGEERQYVENGLKAGLKILGFSDHGPYIFPGSYYSTFRMRLDQLDDYVETVLSLRGVYDGQIEIPLGLELEYYPDLLPELLPVLRDYPLDYLLLGQHFVGNEVDSSYCGAATDSKSVLKQYVYQTMDAMNSGLFTYFAHPDLLNYQGDKTLYAKEMKQLCREAKACGVPLEYNLLGLATERHYPNDLFWKIAAEEDCDVIFGRDAHAPQALLDTYTEARAMEHLRTLGLKPLTKISLRAI